MNSDTPLDESFILVGADQSQVLPARSEPAAPAPAPAPTSQAARPTPSQPEPHASAAADYKPGAAPSYAHDWSRAATGGLRTHGRHFVDAHGRVCLLRGVNLAGNSKLPVNFDHGKFPAGAEAVSFVGRPFPLEHAPEHLARLRRWGLTLVRVLVTWEAVEHAGPGIYDTEYLDYLRALISLFPTYGITCFVNMHQDVWSRYAGGSGAPAWTLEAVGFDLHALEESGAAWLKGVKGGGHTEDERGVWPTGYQKLAAATMATVFWAGDVFAPKLRVRTRGGDELSAQQFLQSAFLNMWETVARALGDLDAVLGFEIMNEPHHGYINLPSLHEFNYNTDLHLSAVPTALQSFMLGAGHPTTVPVWTRSFPLPTRRTSSTLLNANGRKAWRADGPTQGKDVWQMHGVWGYDEVKKAGVVLRENYFVKHPASGKPVDFYTDFYFPFVNRWTARVRGASSATADKLVFAEAIPNEFCPASWGPVQPANMVYAPHWYDLRVLFEKAHGEFAVNVQGLSRGMFPLKAFYWGQAGARDNVALQIRNIVEEGYKSLGERPVVIGECGLPMDMNKGEAFRSGDFTWQRRMMDAMMTGLERALVGFTLWNYNPDNDDGRGDDWNGENFSWFSAARASQSTLAAGAPALAQDAAALDAGARILEAVVRPYAAKTAGVPLAADYEMATGTFAYSWAVPFPSEDAAAAAGKGSPSVRDPPRAHAPLRARETEVFLPEALTRGRKIVVSGLGADEWAHDAARQTFFILPKDDTPGRVYSVEIELDPPLGGVPPNDFWGDFGGYLHVGSMVLLLLVAWLVMR